jgi:RNA polymerase sigma-70 factor (ECF subfamily)
VARGSERTATGEARAQEQRVDRRANAHQDPAPDDAAPDDAAPDDAAPQEVASSGAASQPLAGPATSVAARVARARALVDGAKKGAQATDERRQKERARDEALVARARDGDAAAFSQLVGAHQGRLFSVAFGMLRDRDDAMDVVQDAFIKAHRKLSDFEGNSAFSTWLYRITVNLCIDKKRAVARRRQTDLDDVAGRDFESDPLYAEADFAPRLQQTNPLRNVGNKELGQQIGRGLAQLSEDHRAIVLLREVEGMSYDEIAATLGIPRGTVMSRLFHARKNLQRVLRPLLGLVDGEDPHGGPDAVEDDDQGSVPASGRAAPREDRGATGRDPGEENAPPGRPTPAERSVAPEKRP